MNTLPEALGFVLAGGAVILFCRAFPFLFFPRVLEADSSKAQTAFLNFVEKIVPPVVMTVLAFNALAAPFLEKSKDGLLVLAASVFTAMLHLWKGNSLLSIIGGTALYMLLIRAIT